MRLVDLTHETNWACYLQKGGHFYYFLNILQRFTLSVYLCLLQSGVVIDIFLGNHPFYLKGAGSLLRILMIFSVIKNCLGPEKVQCYSFHLFFLSPPHIVPWFVSEVPKLPGSAVLLFPATTHSAAILSSTLWDCNLLFLFLYRSPSSGLLIPEIPSHFVIPLFFLFQYLIAVLLKCQGIYIT